MGCLQQMVKLLNRLDPDNRFWKATQINKLKEELNKTIEQSDYEELENNIKSVFDNQLNDPDYARKLFLIQNCLYGADIQPIAMQITKLRFFISLLVDQENDPQKENYGILALPNLETKFIAANSLIQLDKQQNSKHKTFFVTSEEVENKKKELEGVREKYFKARTQRTKRKYRAKDKKLRNEIADLLGDLGFENKAAQQIAEWNPFNPDSKSDWFNAEWMFGTREFDIVIGNPPYIQLQKALPGKNIKYADVYKDQDYATFERTGDIYSLFYEMGLEITSPKGVLSYITSNKWMRAKYGKSLRNYFADKKPLKLIDLGPGIFDSATVDTNILFVRNQKSRSQELKAVALESKAQMEQPKLLKFGAVSNPGENNWIILNPQEQAIKEKIERIGKPLKKWDVTINRGILTGYNKAFIVDGNTKDELIKQDPKSAELLKPILRGRDIKRYKAEFADLWLIATFPAMNINIDDYPAIKNFLLQFGKKLNQTGETYKDESGKKIKSRKKTGNKWFETQDQIGYWKDFEKDKVVWKRIGSIIRFSNSTEGEYSLDSTVLMTGEKMKYLTALLNSKLFICELILNSPKTGTGDVIISVQALTPLLLHYPDEEVENKFADKVTEILKMKELGEDTEELEHQIDLMVYKLYDLTYEQARLIDPDLEKEDFDAVQLDSKQQKDTDSVS